MEVFCKEISWEKRIVDGTAALESVTLNDKGNVRVGKAWLMRNQSEMHHIKLTGGLQGHTI